jgi:hypothetical protein
MISHWDQRALSVMLVVVPPEVGVGARVVAPWVVPVLILRSADARLHAPRDWPFFPIWLFQELPVDRQG